MFFRVHFFDRKGQPAGDGVMTPTEAIAAAQGRLIAFGSRVAAFKAWEMSPAERGLPVQLQR